MKVGIVGLGLMGASLGKAIRAKELGTVFGTDLSEDVMLKANLVGAIDCVLDTENAQELDVLVVSVYPRNFGEVAKKYLPYLRSGATVIDFCGIKREVCEEMKRLSEQYEEINFIGGHPMAGREFSGIERSLATLFEKASMIFVPVRADIFCEQKMKEFFLSLGFAEVVFSTPEIHDAIIAFTSQLCHIVSNAFIKSPTALQHHGFSAGSYRDLTRVARLSPEMWSQLMMDNRDKLSFELKTLISNLKKYSDALDSGDEEELKRLLAEGNERKLTIDARKKK